MVTSTVTALSSVAKLVQAVVSSKDGDGGSDEEVGFVVSCYRRGLYLPVLRDLDGKLLRVSGLRKGGAGKTSNEGCGGVCEGTRGPERSCSLDTASTTISIRNATLMIGDSWDERECMRLYRRAVAVMSLRKPIGWKGECRAHPARS